MSYLLSELAAHFNLELEGQPDIEIRQVASLENAGQGDISFCVGKKHLKELQKTAATAVILHPDNYSSYNGNALLTDNPHLYFARIARLINPPQLPPAGVDPTARVAENAFVHDTAAIAANVTIDSSATISAGCVVGAGSYIGESVFVGEGTVIGSNVTVHHGTEVGKNCVFQSGCVIGSDGFGHARDGDHWEPVPQLGKVKIGNNVSVGANTAIDRGALGETCIGSGVKLDNLVHVAHNVTIGDDTAIAACCGIAGSTHIGKRCTFAGQVGVVDNITICDDAHFTGQTAVRTDITKPGVYSSGILLEENQSWARNAMRFKKLDSLFKQVRELTRNRK